MLNTCTHWQSNPLFRKRFNEQSSTSYRQSALSIDARFSCCFFFVDVVVFFSIFWCVFRISFRSCNKFKRKNVQIGCTIRAAFFFILSLSLWMFKIQSNTAIVWRSLKIVVNQLSIINVHRFWPVSIGTGRQNAWAILNCAYFTIHGTRFVFRHCIQIVYVAVLCVMLNRSFEMQPIMIFEFNERNCYSYVEVVDLIVSFYKHVAYFRWIFRETLWGETVFISIDTYGWIIEKK